MKHFTIDIDNNVTVEAVTFEFHLPFDHLVLAEMFAGIPVDSRCIPYTKVLQPIVTKPFYKKGRKGSSSETRCFRCRTWACRL
jgi:hypothetical protein